VPLPTSQTRPGAQSFDEAHIALHAVADAQVIPLGQATGGWIAHVPIPSQRSALRTLAVHIGELQMVSIGSGRHWPAIDSPITFKLHA
jgi:hypothetical protein